MLSNKHTGIIIGIITAAALCLSLAAVFFADSLTAEEGGKSQEYETALFDTAQPLEINIKISENDWQNMLENALEEEYYSCDVEVNGETFSNVGIRPKGNTSLTNIASDPDTDRYSFKLEFDKYTDGQSCYGLDKLVLNNNYADATNMKEAIVYDMYNFLDADASLYNYAAVYVNGEYWGVYLALEAVEESFLERTYGSLDGNLYKTEGMNMGDNDKGNKDINNKDMPGMPNSEDKPDMPQANDKSSAFNGKADQNDDENGETGDKNNSSKPPDFNPQNNSGEQDTKENPPDFEKGGGFGGSSSGGADLNYTDDELNSYSTIWDGSVNDSTKQDHKKVIKALKNISEGNNIEEYLDVDNLLKYMAVHTFVVNLDSLSGNMPHNYYLYEDDGRLNIIPWDYNLAFGGMGGMSMGGNSDSASSTINFAIDSPFSGTEFFNALLENAEYKAVYHSYLQKLAEEYVDGGAFDKAYNRIRSQIDSLVKTDPTAFYTYEEFTAAADMLYKTVSLRAESVLGQLSGAVPSTKEAQEANTEALIDSSEIDLSVMGQMNGGGGGFSGEGLRPDERQSEKTAETSPESNVNSAANDRIDNSDVDGGTENTGEQSAAENTQKESSVDLNEKDKMMPPGSAELQNNIWRSIAECSLCFLFLIGVIIFVKFKYGRKK